MGRLDEITLEELYEVKEQMDEGKLRERVLAAIGRKQGDQLDTLAERHGVVEKTIRNWLPTMLLDQEVQQRSKDKTVSSCSTSCNSRQLNLATTSKRGQRSSWFTT